MVDCSVRFAVYVDKQTDITPLLVQFWENGFLSTEKLRFLHLTCTHNQSPCTHTNTHSLSDSTFVSPFVLSQWLLILFFFISVYCSNLIEYMIFRFHQIIIIVWFDETFHWTSALSWLRAWQRVYSIQRCFFLLLLSITIEIQHPNLMFICFCMLLACSMRKWINWMRTNSNNNHKWKVMRFIWYVDYYYYYCFRNG